MVKESTWWPESKTAVNHDHMAEKNQANYGWLIMWLKIVQQFSNKDIVG